jgi:hypothetical protein
LCTCQHVTTTNKEHCLQSREQSSIGIKEGFAYFWAAENWNNKSQSDCIMGFPKEVKMPILGVNWTFSPPYPANCVSPRKWKVAQCPDDSTATATEWDWMNFFWNLYSRNGSYNVSMIDLYDLIHRSCSGYPRGKCYPGNDSDRVTYPMMRNAAIGKWGSTSQEYENFRDWADLNGVNQ